MIGVQCRKHTTYNGANDPAEYCQACWQIRSIRILLDNMPPHPRCARVIQPINLVVQSLKESSTEALLKEVKDRIDYDGG